MQRLLALSDYLFYRISNFFRNHGDKVSNTSALSILSILEFFTLLDLLAIVQITFDLPNPPKIYALGVAVILLFINLKRYETELILKKIKNKWVDEKISIRRRNDILIVSYMILSILSPLVFKLV